MDRLKKVMVADDDPGILDAVCIMLEYAGYEVYCTPDGAELLTMNSGFPDLLLLDIWMSGLDGRDICKQLKKQAVSTHMPIVLISASNDIARSAIEAGANDFLAKPFDMDVLLEKIEKILRAESPV